ncbi:hypothetical protein GGS26DRAFT_556980 [Hypomontagnella submonticulosa]|nr:hypothetical protein GGS26DRAFT_556980 [Hypomontagnella submonticulosa]
MTLLHSISYISPCLCWISCCMSRTLIVHAIMSCLRFHTPTTPPPCASTFSVLMIYTKSPNIKLNLEGCGKCATGPRRANPWCSNSTQNWSRCGLREDKFGEQPFRH